MGSYAVTWRERRGPLYAGKLQLASAGLRLEGRSRSGRTISVVKLRYDDVRRVAMAAFHDRLADQPTVEVIGPQRSLYIAPTGPGVAREVLELMQHGDFEEAYT